MTVLFCCRFCSELGPGNVMFGFLAKNNTGYANVQPNGCHSSPFHEQFNFFIILYSFCLELGPRSVIFGFFASNYTGYTNYRPNWRQDCFFSELDPRSVTIGFFAKNYTGYTNYRPNWRQESLFYEHLICFTMYSPAPPSDTGHSFKKIRNFYKYFPRIWKFKVSFLIARFPYHRVKGVRTCKMHMYMCMRAHVVMRMHV